MKLLKDILKNASRKPFTQRYPRERPVLPEGLRGKVEHLPEKCIYCGLCAKACPSGAIIVNPKTRTWAIDLGKCLFCQACEEVCRDIVKKNAIKLSKTFEMATTDKKGLRYRD